MHVALGLFTALVFLAPAFAADPDGLQIIDAHLHTKFTGKTTPGSGIVDSKEAFLAELRAAGVVGAIAHTRRYEDGAQDLGAQGVVHCAGVDAVVDAQKLEAGLKANRFRCIKIYLGYVHQYAHHANYKVAYRLAEKYDVPVVFHTGDTYDVDGKLKYADPLTIDEVAVDHRKVTFVIAHVGNPWIQSAAEVAYKNANVFLDGSALLIGDLDKTPKDKADEFVVQPLAWTFGYVEDPSKLMFGTDWPLAPIGAYVKLFKRAIPKEHWKAVFHDNAVKVFRLDRKGNKQQP